MIARDYQTETIENVFDSYHRGISSGIIKCATGLGKSFLATEIAKRWRQEGRGKALFLVDQIDLAYQARGAFKSQFPNLKIGLEMNDHHAEGDEDIIISCVPSIGRKGSKRIGKFNPDDFTLTFADEAHKSMAPSWLRVLSFLGVHPDNFTPGKLLVGLTATPKRKGGGLGYLYHDFFANFDVIYGMREGWLVTPEWIKVKTNTDISKVKFKGEDFDRDELSEAINEETRNHLIVKSFEDEGMLQSIVYCASVAHAYQVRDLFKAKGYNAECIEANTDKGDRKDWMQAFRDQEIDVLLNYGTLAVGVDFPELRQIVLARPIGSDVLYQQILGRVLRPSQFAMVDAMPDAESRRLAISLSQKPYAKVIDLVDTSGGHRLHSPLTLLGLSDKLKTEDKVRVFEQVYEPLEKVKKEHGIDISLIEDLGEIDSIVTRSRGMNLSLRTPTVLTDLTNLRWLGVGEEEYELVLTKAKKSVVITQNLVDQWEIHEYDQRSKSGLGKKLNTFNTLAGAIRVADEYVQQTCKEDYPFLVRNAPHQLKPPTDKQLKFVAKLYGRNAYWEGDKLFIRFLDGDRNVPVTDREVVDGLIKRRISGG